jgi:hypothetical protein
VPQLRLPCHGSNISSVSGSSNCASIVLVLVLVVVVVAVVVVVVLLL